jgi:predicted nucleic acid-binding protein
MRLSELKAGARVFIDANIFLYHFAGISWECKEFLKRCEAQELIGVTGVTLLAEVCHHLMIAEASRDRRIRPQRPAVQLQEKPEMVKKLPDYAAQVTSIRDWGISVVAPPSDLLERSQVFRTQFGLLTNDSFVPVYMTLSQVDNLATNDQAFARIPSLHLYYPTDVGRSRRGALR